jgi:NADPH2:quinone reductase
VFRYEDVPDPQVGPGNDVLIEVEAVSIEGGDTLNRLGGDLARVPHVVGYQCAGTVLAVGARSGTSSWGTGRSRWAWTARTPSCGRRPNPSPGRSPTGVSTDDAACVPVPFGTADDCLFEFGHLAGGRDGP